MLYVFCDSDLLGLEKLKQKKTVTNWTNGVNVGMYEPDWLKEVMKNVLSSIF